MSSNAAHRGINPKLRRTMRASVADGAAFSVMVGVGEAYLPAFVLAVGLGEVIAGLTATLPMLTGATLQLLSPRLIARLGSHRRWVFLCALAQGLAFLPLVAAALYGRVPALVVMGIATLYWGAGLAAGPAWNTWMSRAIPAEVRAPYFAGRARIAQLCVLTGLFGGGALLSRMAASGSPLLGFAIAFALACFFRLLSAVLLLRQHEPGSFVSREQNISMVTFLKRLPGGEGRLLAYMLLVQSSTYISAPFFTPYMLGKLKLEYGIYMVLLAIAFLSKALTLPLAGRFAQRFGARALLWVGGIGVVPLAGLWIFSESPGYLLLLQIFGGAAWGCYEFATFLLLFEMIRDEERTGMLTCYNFLNAFAIAVGSIVGGLLLRAVGVGMIAYAVVFGVSTLGRLLTLFLLRAIPHVDVAARPIAFRVLAVRPSAGSDDRPIIESLPAADPAASETTVVSEETVSAG